MKKRHLIIALLIPMLLTACSGFNMQQQANRTVLSANDYLTLAQNANGAAQQQYRLQAAQTYLNNHQVTMATRILNQLDPDQMTPAMLTQQQLLLAQAAIDSKQYQPALDRLNQHQQNLDPQQQILWHQLSANAYAGLNNISQAILTRTTLAPLLKDNNTAYQQNSQHIWDYLENLNTPQLQDLDLQSEDPKIQSWAELALLLNQTDSAPGQLSDALNQWRSKFPNQLANSLLPASFNTNAINNQKIALLVPLDGTYGASGTAVRNGFFAAYYYWKSQLNRAPDITVINTANTDINTAYQQALQQGATMVVGPLTKPNINNLISQTTLTVPTLALNNVPNNSDTTNLYQFGLSPINEAQQTALKALQNQHSNALIITSNTAWGKNIANSFSQTWQQHGGRIVDELDYNQASSLSAQLRSLLNIDQTRKRAQQLRWMLGEKFRYVPRRRKDFDSIFFVGTDKIGKQVRPLLKYYYAGNVPIYSISPVYAGNANVLRDRDLNGILFCDIPWVLEQQKLKPSYLRVIKHSIQTQWPRSYRQQPKLYAFGVDAFDITLKLNKMMMLPLLGTHAATGTLYLQANRQIYRQLPFAQFVKGRAELVR